MSLDRHIIEVLIYCILLEVTPSKISNNFLLKQTDGEVFHPFDINHINRSVVKSLRSSLKSYRTKPLGGKSKFIPLKRGWKIESVLRPKSHCTVTLPLFTEEHYNSQFYLPDTASTATPANKATSTSTSPSSSSATNNPTNIMSEEPPTYGPTPLYINQGATIDDEDVDYSLGIAFNKKGFFALTGPWGVTGGYFPKLFEKNNQLRDGLLLFFKGSNKLDLFANAENVCTVCDDKKGIIIKQKDGINTDFILEICNTIVNDPDRFGKDAGQAIKFCKVFEKNLKKSNASTNMYSVHLDFTNFPFNLTPGTYQFQETYDINNKGLSAALIELRNGEDGFFVAVAIADDEGKDDLESDEEEVDVKAEARRRAQERNERKSTGGTSAGRFSNDFGVDDITDRFAGLNVGHGATPSTTKTPRNVLSPHQKNRNFFQLIGDEFKSYTPANTPLGAICSSLLDEDPGIDEDKVYIQAMKEMIDNHDHYSSTFGVEFVNNPLAQITATASARGMVVFLYDADDYEGGPELPEPTEIDSYNHNKTATIVYMLKAEDKYYSLTPYPTEDPEDSSIDSPLGGDSPPPLYESPTPSPSEKEEKRAPSSIEKIKSYFFGGSSTEKKEQSSAVKKYSARKEDTSPTPEILLTPPPPRRRPTNTTKKNSAKKNSAKKNLLNHLGDDMSTAKTVQTGSGMKQTKVPQRMKKKAPPAPPRRSARHAEKKN